MTVIHGPTADHRVQLLYHRRLRCGRVALDDVPDYLLCALLDLPGQAESRQHIQSWLQGAELPEKNAKRIFGAADRIMKAGQPVQRALD